MNIFKKNKRKEIRKMKYLLEELNKSSSSSTSSSNQSSVKLRVFQNQCS